MTSNPLLAKEIMKSIDLDNVEDYVDPWRLYQDCDLFKRVIDHCIESLKEQSIDAVAAVSELGLPLAVSISQGLRKKKDVNLPVLVLSIRNNALKIRPYISLEGKSVLLCDDLLAGGTHMRDQILKLKELGARTESAIVLLDNIDFPERDPVTQIKSNLEGDLIVLTDSSLYKQVHK